MEIADQYFNNCRMIATTVPELTDRRVRYQIFTREDGVLAGANRAVNFIKENTYGPLRITGQRDGERFTSGQPVLTVESNFAELSTLETTELGFLSFSGGATDMAKIVKAAEGVPVIDMSARHYPWQIITEAAEAAYLGGAAGTSTEAGYKHVEQWYQPGDKFKLYASLPHAMAAVVAEMAERENLFPSVVAAKLFHQKWPDRPITVLVDYEGRELDVAKQAFEVFGDKLFAVRLDTHGGRQMQGVHVHEGLSSQYLQKKLGKQKFFQLVEELNEADPGMADAHTRRHLRGRGVTVEAAYRMRDFLDSIGAKNTKIVVSSGFNETKVATFRKAGAPMDFIGTGSWVRFAMFTADISHVWENGGWKFRTKVGRNHGDTDHHNVLFVRK